MAKLSTKAAVIGGTFLRPGMSKNRRLYTPENIGKAVQRMQEAINSPSGLPINMATSHAAAYGDDALATVARVTKVGQSKDGSAYFEADVANTTNGRDVAVGAVGGFIKGISIRGGWMTAPHTVEAEDGGVADTADDMAVLGIDFTSRPGVEGAQIESATFSESYNGTVLTAFHESVEEAKVVELFSEEDPGDKEARIREAVENAVAEILEKDTSKSDSDVKYADPGYQSDKKKRYPVVTEANVRAAWAHILQEKNAEAYTPAQLSRIKSKIKSTSKKLGVDVQEEFNFLASEMREVLEGYASMSINNGQGSISVSGYSTPDGLAAVAMRIAAAAMTALNAMDPDGDGDIDVPGSSKDEDSTESAPSVDTDDGSSCLLCNGAIEDTNMYCPSCGAPVPQVESTEETLTQTNKEDAMTAPIVKTAEELAADKATSESTATAVTFSAEDIQKIVAEALASAKATEVAEAAAAAAVVASEAAAIAEAAAKPQTYTLEEAMSMAAEAAKAAVTEAKAQAVAEYRESAPTRKGVVGTNVGALLDESNLLDEAALAKLGPNEFRSIAGQAWALQPAWSRKLAQADQMANG